MEKLLVLSNFSFCHNVFKSCLQQRRQKASVCGKGLTKLCYTRKQTSLHTHVNKSTWFLVTLSDQLVNSAEPDLTTQMHLADLNLHLSLKCLTVGFTRAHLISSSSTLMQKSFNVLKDIELEHLLSQMKKLNV